MPGVRRRGEGEGASKKPEPSPGVEEKQKFHPGVRKNTQNGNYMLSALFL